MRTFLKYLGSIWRDTHYHGEYRCECGTVFEHCNQSTYVKCPACKESCAHKSTHTEHGTVCRTYCDECHVLLEKDDYSYWPGEYVPMCKEVNTVVKTAKPESEAADGANS